MTRLLVSPEALAQAEAIDDWWRRNRPASPDLFADELASALDDIETAPEIGTRVVPAPVPNLRRVVLRATRYHVYYAVVGETARVVAVWSSLRGRGPNLSSLR